jgi:hypothetical protein
VDASVVFGNVCDKVLNISPTWVVLLLVGKAENLLAEILPLLFSQVMIAGQKAAGL